MMQATRLPCGERAFQGARRGAGPSSCQVYKRASSLHSPDFPPSPLERGNSTALPLGRGSTTRLGSLRVGTDAQPAANPPPSDPPVTPTPPRRTIASFRRPSRSQQQPIAPAPSPQPAAHLSASPPQPSQAAPASASTPSARPGDLRLDLWLSLLQTTAAQISAVASSGAARLQRLAQPPPDGFPAGPPGDQTVRLVTEPLRFLEETTATYGSVVGIMLGGERVVLVSGRAEARAVLVEQAGSVYVKEGTAFLPGSSITGNGLLVSDGAVWQRQRRLATPAFRTAAVEAYGGAMVAATRRMLDRAWAAGGTRDVYADFNTLTLQVTLEALFGFPAERGEGGGRAGGPGGGPATGAATAAGTDEDEEAIVESVRQAFTFLTQRAATSFIIPEWLPTWDNLEFAGVVQRLDRVVYGMIERRRADLAATHGSVAAAAAAAAAPPPASHEGGSSSNAARPVPGDLLTSLLLSRDADGSGMTDGQLRDELMTLLFAGQETSAILLGWAAALLAAHPEAQEAAAAEVAAVCGQAVPTPASVRRMPYVESVLLEAMRLYSPAYIVGRCARADTTLGGHTVPAGTTVLVSPYVMHRDAGVWEQPAAFQPERWRPLQEREGYQGSMSLLSNLGPNGAYLPFGAGPRNCIGTGFAMMEAMLVTASLLQRYRLELPAAATQGSVASSRPTDQWAPGAGAGQTGRGPEGFGPGFPEPKPLLTLRPDGVVLRVTPRAGE